MIKVGRQWVEINVIEKAEKKCCITDTEEDEF